MPKFAEISETSKTVNIIIDTDADPAFSPDILRQFDSYVELTKKQAETVAEGWGYDGKAFTPPPPEPEPTLDELKERKLAEIKAAYDDFDRNGSVVVTLGYPIQCGQSHVQKFDGAIRYAEQMNAPTIYITDANDVTHYDVPIADAKRALLEVTAQSLKAHALKQELRTKIEAARDKAEIDAIQWTM